MSVVNFSVTQMKQDLSAFGSAVSSFMELKELSFQEQERTLEAAVRSARADKKLNFLWASNSSLVAPTINTLASKDYRNGAKAATSLQARVSFQLVGRIESAASDIVSLSGGGTTLEFVQPGKQDRSTNLHFDIHGAGMAKGHPFLHVQFKGLIKEIPRLGVHFAHPLDVVEFALMELFQQKWRAHLDDSKIRQLFHNFPVQQVFRLGAILDWMVAQVRDKKITHPFQGLQATPDPPIFLHKL